MNRDELAEHIEGFMAKVPGEDDRAWDSVQMADYLLSKMDKQIIPVVAAVITVGTRFLLHRLTESRNPELLGKWEFPGGMMEYDEAPWVALLREITEELGWIDITISRLFHAKTFIPKSGEHYLVLFYEATIPIDTPIPKDCALFLREEIPYGDCLEEVREVIELGVHRVEGAKKLWNDILLNVRICNCLRRAGITTVEQLCQKTERDLCILRNFGKGSLQELKEGLAKKGLSLAKEKYE